jgi:hypothetical protein
MNAFAGEMGLVGVVRRYDPINPFPATPNPRTGIKAMAGDKDDRKSSRRPGAAISKLSNRKNSLPEREVAARRAAANRKMHKPKGC